MNTIKEWHQLSNRYWLKINLFKPMPKCWSNYSRDREYLLDIAVGKTRRIVNDHYNSKRGSSKSLYNKSTNHGTGIEVFKKVLQFLDRIVEKLPVGSVIRIEGSDEKRIHVYSRLLRYGFIESQWFAPGRYWHRKTFYLKVIQ